MKIVQTKFGYRIEFMQPTKEINIITSCRLNIINQDSLDRIYLTISKE
jgi:hypothetical protein